MGKKMLVCGLRGYTYKGAPHFWKLPYALQSTLPSHVINGPSSNREERSDYTELPKGSVCPPLVVPG